MISSIPSRLAASFEHDMAQRYEVSDLDIHFSRLSGMSPPDIDVLCDFTRDEALLVIIRCPKRPARYFHGIFDPKPKHVGEKCSLATGLVTDEDGKTYVSDYDLMCVWRFFGQGHYEKIAFQAVSEKHPMCFSPEANALVAKLDGRLRSQRNAKRAFQHGAQDDYDSPENPNIRLTSDNGKPIDRFMIFNVGAPKYVCNGAELKTIYEQLFGKDAWPYDADGIYHYSGLGHA